MDFPVGIGDQALGAAAVAERFRAVLRRLQGRGAYTTEAGSVREAELLAAGTAAAVGAQIIDRAWKNSVPSQASELLSDWEEFFFLPNDAARTDDERRTRLRAIQHLMGRASWTDLQAVLRIVAQSATLHGNTRDMVVADAAPEEAIFAPLVTLDDVDYDDPKVRLFCALLLRRAVPARCCRLLHSRDVRRGVATGYEAIWNSVDARLGRDAIGQQTAVARENNHPPARVVPYGPLSPLDGDELNLVQDGTLLVPASANRVEYNTSDAKWFTKSFAASIAATSIATIDSGGLSGGDWLSRLLVIELKYDATDIRPGQGADATINGGGTAARIYWFTGAGGEAGYEYNVDANIRLYVDAALGELVVRNLSGGTLRVVAFVIASGVVGSPAGGGSSTTRRLAHFADGSDLADLDRAFLDAMSQRHHAKPDGGSGGGADPWNQHPGGGGVQRLACVVNFPKTAPAATRILDATCDWRDRLLAIWWGFKDVVFANESNFPGAPTDNEWGSGSTSNRQGYTRLGGASGVGTLDLAYHIELETAMRLYARSSDGALCLDLDNDYVSDGSSVLIRIWASPQLGERSAPAVHPSPTATDGLDEVDPNHLNFIQDPVALDQVRGTSTLASQAYPLGPVVRHGSPYIPEVWTVRGSELRQPLEASRRVWFALSLATGTDTLIDDSIDWRDRFLIGMGRRHTSDIRPGRAADADYDTGSSAWAGAEMTGSGQANGAIATPGYYIVLTTGIAIYARSSDGKLYIRNETGGTRYVVGTLEGSFQLGPRLPR